MFLIFFRKKFIIYIEIFIKNTAETIFIYFNVLISGVGHGQTPNFFFLTNTGHPHLKKNANK